MSDDPHVTYVDDLPVVWKQDTGTKVAGIVFRVGTSDETMHTRGISHLIEHLAFDQRDLVEAHSNGTTDSTTVTFYRNGSEEEVLGFLTQICQSLLTLPFHRLEHEKRILRAEDNQRSNSLFSLMMRWRYGCYGYGLSGSEEFGVHDISPQWINGWLERYFTRGNAAVFMNFEPPANFDLPLRPGPARMPQSLEPTLLEGFPSYFNSPTNTDLLMSAVIPRSLAGPLLGFVLERRLVEELRAATGASYSPSASYTPMTSTNAWLSANSDCLDGYQTDASRTFVSMLGRLSGDVADQYVTEEEVATFVKLARRAKDEMNAISTVASYAQSLVIGHKPLPSEELIRQWELLTPADVTDLARIAYRSAFYAVPRGVDLPPPYTKAKECLLPVIPGTRYESGDKNAETYVMVSDEGVSIVTKEGERWLSFPFASLAGATTSTPDDLTLYAADFNILTLQSKDWAAGRQLLDQVRQRIRPGLLMYRPAQ